VIYALGFPLFQIRSYEPASVHGIPVQDPPVLTQHSTLRLASWRDNHHWFKIETKWSKYSDFKIACVNSNEWYIQ
jgi:hypothetical protein